MKIAIIEDERPAARMLVDLLARVAPDAVVIAQLASVADVKRWLAHHEVPDLFFADIELRDGRVFEAFGASGQVAPTIFTTAYDQFMVDAFRAHGISYLLKPLSERDVAAALAKYEDLRRAFSTSHQLERRLDGERPYRRHFAVHVGHKIHLLAVERAALVRLGLAGIEVIDVDGARRPLAGNASLTEVEASLPPAQYFRINRTEIVRLDAIVHLDPLRDRVLLSVRGLDATLAVSVHRTSAFRGWVGLG